MIFGHSEFGGDEKWSATRRRAIAMLAALALVATGCGTDRAGTADLDAPDGDVVTTVDPAATAEPEGAVAPAADADEDLDHRDDAEVATSDDPDDRIPDDDAEAPHQQDPPDMPDPRQVPDQVDVAYVDAVIVAIVAEGGSLTRSVLERNDGRPVTTDVLAWARALYDGPYYWRSIGALGEATDPDAREARFLPLDRRGEVRWETDHVAVATDECILALGVYDNTEVAVEPTPTDALVVAMLSRHGDAVGTERNPTAWRLHGLNFIGTSEDDLADRAAGEELLDRVDELLDFLGPSLEIDCDPGSP